MKRCKLCNEYRDEDREACFRCGAMLYDSVQRQIERKAFITDVDDLEGEVVACAVDTDCGGIAIRFESGSVFVAKIEPGYDCTDDCSAALEFSTQLSLSEKQALGLMTMDEYQTAMLAAENERKAARESRERAELEKLKRKYEAAT